MDISHLQQFRAEADTARKRAERTGTRHGDDPVWSPSAATVFASISAIAGHLAVVAAAYPHADGLVRQQISRLAEAVTALYAQLTEPPSCEAESVVGVGADGVLVVEECARLRGHRGEHSSYGRDRWLLDDMATLLADVNKLSDGIRRAILLSPGRPDGELAGRTTRRVLSQLNGRAVATLRRIAVAIDHRPPRPVCAVAERRWSGRRQDHDLES